jgi:hypothetical protein
MARPDSLMGLHPDDQADIYAHNRSPIIIGWLTVSLLVAMAVIMLLIGLYVYAAPPGLTIVPKSSERLFPELPVDPILAQTLKLEI